MLFSEQSRRALAGVFERSAKSTLPRSAADVCEIHDQPGGAAFSGDPLLVLTITSFAFRLMTLFHVDDNEATHAYFVPAAAKFTLQQVFAEIANLCCGAMNRELSALFPHLAMSIPCMLSAGCIEHLPRLNAEYTSRLSIKINDTVKLGVTLCMCCSATVEIPAALGTAEKTTGELEMF